MLFGRAIDGTGRILACGSVSGERVSFFDLENGEELARVSVPANASQPFDFDPVGGGLFTTGTRGVMLWPLRSEPGRPALLRVGPPQPFLSGAGDSLRGLSAAARNDRVLTTAAVTAAILIHRASASPPLTLEPEGVYASEISPDGKWVAI